MLLPCFFRKRLSFFPVSESNSLFNSCSFKNNLKNSLKNNLKNNLLRTVLLIIAQSNVIVSFSPYIQRECLISQEDGTLKLFDVNKV